jgi:serine/threonine protein kinase
LYQDESGNSTSSGNSNSRKGPFGGIPIHSATLYAATIILALEHIHDQGYTFRDLKPENLLIASNGYLKLVDFGFAKAVPFINKSQQIQYRTFTLCGTPDYMAP